MKRALLAALLLAVSSTSVAAAGQPQGELVGIGFSDGRILVEGCGFHEGGTYEFRLQAPNGSVHAFPENNMQQDCLHELLFWPLDDRPVSIWAVRLHGQKATVASNIVVVP